MQEKNVKIIINEVDNTSPAGRSTDSTDIAFVPGFSILADAPVNKPVLCTTVKDFEALFGTSPRILTGRDVTSAYEKYGLYAGDPDRGYVYAKELLYNGLSVVYTNLNIEPNTVLSCVESSVKCKVNSESKFVEDPSKLTATYDPKKSAIVVRTSAEKFQGVCQVTTDIQVSVPAKQRVVYELAPVLTNCSITYAEIKLDDKAVSSDVIKYSSTMFEFVNNSTSADAFSIAVEITLDVSLQSSENALIQLKNLTSSLLDAFYSSGTTKIKEQLQLVSDKSIYSVKYITSGGYPSVVNATTGTSVSGVFAADMINAAATRGDAVALIDYQLDNQNKVYSSEASSVYAKMHSFCSALGNPEYGAAMYPWAHYNCANSGIADLTMPASFAYLVCLAKAIKTSPNWLAMAGVSRGVVRGIKTLCTPNNVLSNTEAENAQPKFGTDDNKISINCITDIKPYGLTLWGNRTLLPVSSGGTTALNFLNTRNMLSDIKKLLYTTAKSLMFEQNSDFLWLKFKNGITPLLNQLKSGNGISDYKIIKGTTKYNGDPLTKGEISAVIKIYPLYAVEYFELTVEINDEDVVVS